MKKYKRLAVRVIVFPEDAIRTSGDNTQEDDEEHWTNFY